MKGKWKTNTVRVALVAAAALMLLFITVQSARAPADAVQPQASLIAVTAPQAEPEHHTVTVRCPGTVTLCTGGRLLIQTSDGGSWSEGFTLGGNTNTTFTFTGLTGGGQALDAANPDVYCLANDSTTIPMGPGASVTGGNISPSTFTVPPGVAATVTISCL